MLYKATYEQYKDSDNEEKQSWGEQAKMRANKTATEYNNYILKNEKDVEEIVTEIKKGLEIVFVEQLSEVLEVALVK